MDRRKFLMFMGTSGVVSALSTAKVAQAGVHTFPYYPNGYGVLHDTTRCIGCRRCEKACNKVNNLPKPAKPLDDLTVTATKRRPSAYEWTVVNKYKLGDKDYFRKWQCMHCNDPACASACFAKCFQKQPDGSVTYDGTQCVGCRYCMVACPFYMPGFQYDEAWDPLVQKCTFCRPRLQEGKLPGCVEACPVDALTFGRRKDLLVIARQRIKANPERYADYIYGEHDAGGTAWMVLAPAMPAKSGMSKEEGDQHALHAMDCDTHLGNQPMGDLTYGALGAVPMIVSFWPILFGGAYAIAKKREAAHEAEMANVKSEAKQDLGVALDAAVRKLEETQGAGAAEDARKAMSEAIAARKAADHACHGEDK